MSEARNLRAWPCRCPDHRDDRDEDTTCRRCGHYPLRVILESAASLRCDAERAEQAREATRQVKPTTKFGLRFYTPAEYVAMCAREGRT